MGRKRKSEEIDFDNLPLPHSSSIEQPQLDDPVLESLRNPYQLLADAFGIKIENVSDIMELQKHAQMFALARETKVHAQEMRSDSEAKIQNERNGKTAKDRTQEIVEHAYGKDKSLPRWRVFHQRNPDYKWRPEPLDLEIPASSELEAKARYMVVCGITATDHFIRAMPVEKYRKKLAEKDAQRDIEEEYEDGTYDSEDATEE